MISVISDLATYISVSFSFYINISNLCVLEPGMKLCKKD